jgi:L-fuconolactonase
VPTRATAAAAGHVDAHVHFWDGARMAYPWLAEVPAIADPHSPRELVGEAGAAAPSALVFVEAGAIGAHARAEVDWVSALAAQEPRIAAIVAAVAVDRGPETEAALAALAGHPLVRGVRHNLQDHAVADHCLRPSFLSGVARAGEAGLTFDLCIRHHQLPAAIALVRRCPGTQFVLDHGGKPDIRNAVLDPWWAHVAELARLPNVSCKLSGLVTEADLAGWTPAALRPYVERLLECFGPGRLLFGSDWPVVKLAASYRRWLDAALELLAPLTSAERAAVLGENARRIYRLG